MPWQLGTRRQGWYTSGTLRKLFPNLTVQLILSLKPTSAERHGDGHLCLRDGVHRAGEEGRADGDLLGQQAPKLNLAVGMAIQLDTILY